MITVLIKPASSSCNLACKYCFYHDVVKARAVKSYGIMKLETLEALVRRAINEAKINISFAFQGGEPTLAGLDFYEAFINFVNTFNTKGLNISLSIQTNGILIDEAWCRFLKENNFLVGISLDGYKEINDSMRVDSNQGGSYSNILKAVNLFNKFGVEYNILTVVTKQTARHINKIYSFYKKSNFKFLQFIPCIKPFEAKSEQEKYLLTCDMYLQFLKILFDRWFEDIVSGEAISIRQFDNYVAMLMGYPPESCAMSGVCAGYFVVESDGSVYPCDFYVLDKWKIGNIADDSFLAMKNSPIMKRFIEMSRGTDEKCIECRYYSICRGGCRRDREPFSGGKMSGNIYCEAYCGFFDYALPRLSDLAKILRSNSH